MFFPKPRFHRFDRVLRAVSLTLCFAAPLAGCGDSDKKGGAGGDPKPSPKSANACSAVTAADMSTALGEQVGAGQGAETSRSSTCSYRGTDSSTIIKLTTGVTAAEQAATKAQFPRAQPETGLGDEAFYDKGERGVSPTLVALKGKTQIVITYAGDKDALAVSRQLIQQALARV